MFTAVVLGIRQPFDERQATNLTRTRNVFFQEMAQFIDHAALSNLFLQVDFLSAFNTIDTLVNRDVTISLSPPLNVDKPSLGALIP